MEGGKILERWLVGESSSKVSFPMFFSIVIEKDTWMVEMCEQVGEGLQWNPVLQTVT